MASKRLTYDSFLQPSSLKSSLGTLIKIQLTIDVWEAALLIENFGKSLNFELLFSHL